MKEDSIMYKSMPLREVKVNSQNNFKVPQNDLIKKFSRSKNNGILKANSKFNNECEVKKVILDSQKDHYPTIEKAFYPYKDDFESLKVPFLIDALKISSSCLTNYRDDTNFGDEVLEIDLNDLFDM